MHITKLLQLSIASAALLLIGAAAPYTAPESLGSTKSADQLLDPAYLMGSVCRSRKENNGAPNAMKFAMSRIPYLNRAKDITPPLWDHLGDHTYKVSTANETAQAYFDQGFKFIYGFNHAESIRAFRAAQRLDPTCAMCYWGEAYAWGPNLNLPMQADAIKPAYDAIQQALTLAANASQREQDMITALAVRYSEEPDADRAALDVAYADIMKTLYAKYPEDNDIASLYADAVMNTQPWDYWEADMVTPKGRASEIVRSLEEALARDPAHAGAIHFYIHTVEASGAPERAEEGADRLVTLMPGAGHMVHMPSHIYFRIGRFRDSVRVNVAAIVADEAYMAEMKASGIYGGGYYPHNVHFLLASAQMTGNREIILSTAEKLSGKIPDAIAKSAFWTQPVAVASALTYSHFGDIEHLAGEPKPSDDLPYMVAMWHFAHGQAAALNGDVDTATAELGAMRSVAESPDLDMLEANALPARSLAALAEQVLLGRIAQAEGRTDDAVVSLARAVDLQDALPYTEPPFWYYPVRQTLGGILLADGNADDAQKVFSDSLLHYPNNAWALYGLGESQKALGLDDLAAKTQERFSKAWDGGETAIDLTKM